MRSGIILGVTVVLVLLLQGCGRKAALTLPASQAQTSRVQAQGPQTPDPQRSVAPASGEGNEP